MDDGITYLYDTYYKQVATPLNKLPLMSSCPYATALMPCIPITSLKRSNLSRIRFLLKV